MTRLKILLIVLPISIAGCGFKSDLFLPDEQMMPRSAQESMGAANSELSDSDLKEADVSGVAIEIPPLNEQQRRDNKNK